MKRYIFLLLAFFLILNAHAEGMGVSNLMGTIGATPTGLSRDEGVIVKDKERTKATRKKVVNSLKETSSRNTNELGNINESTVQAQRPSKVIPSSARTNGVPNLAAKKGKTAISEVSCKTYEGKVYGQGEAGYNDCIRTIKTDRQRDTAIP
ncbi:MAG: hypothetical protein H7336_08220 [Bacteriovorax sp.]|nr:hypothetical protein [Bacteriovorax sp.]